MLPKENLQSIFDSLSEVRAYMLAKEFAYKATLEELHPSHRLSAQNLIHYLALRTFNMRDIQAALSQFGLSSIGHSERYTLANVDNVMYLLNLLLGKRKEGLSRVEHEVNFLSSWEKLMSHADDLFGDNHSDMPHIMVTLPSEAAENYDLVRDLVASGMNVARINCSHDSETSWSAMIEHVRRAEKELGSNCSVYMDLSGPKIRTGVVEVVGISKKKKSKKSTKAIDFISLNKGDLLHLYSRPVIGRNAILGEKGDVITPAQISVTIPDVFEHIQEGHEVWFDDGKIGSEVVEIAHDHVVLKITHTGVKTGKLKAEKGINFPETKLDLPSLTARDIETLPFIARYADIVGYSFVKEAADVDDLRERLLHYGREDIGMVLKIENRRAFSNLPNLLLAAMRHKKIGVMIARGDLAIEVGWERVSEVQEQILWICEAAHIPIVWATQVLESLAKKGIASRGDITDAAMANRAECVMLNKGSFIVEAVHVLKDILTRMQAHQWKKKETLRALNVAQRFFE